MIFPPRLFLAHSVSTISIFTEISWPSCITSLYIVSQKRCDLVCRCNSVSFFTRVFKKGCRQFHYKIVSARYCTFALLLALFNTFNLQLCVLCVTDGSTVVRIQCLLFQMWPLKILMLWYFKSQCTYFVLIRWSRVCILFVRGAVWRSFIFGTLTVLLHRASLIWICTLPVNMMVEYE